MQETTTAVAERERVSPHVRNYPVRVEPKVQAALEHHAEVIETVQAWGRRTSVKQLMMMGPELYQARSRISRHGNGKFGKWVKERLDMAYKTAERAIAVYQVFGDYFGDLKDHDKLSQFDVSALYVLSANGVPKKHIEEAMARGQQGERVTHAWAKNLVIGAKRAEEEPESEEEYEEDDSPPPKPKSTLDRLKTLWANATANERDEFLQWVHERKVKTDIDGETGLRTVVKEVERHEAPDEWNEE